MTLIFLQMMRRKTVMIGDGQRHDKAIGCDNKLGMGRPYRKDETTSIHLVPFLHAWSMLFCQAVLGQDFG
jgi:hypothetical protein